MDHQNPKPQQDLLNHDHLALVPLQKPRQTYADNSFASSEPSFTPSRVHHEDLSFATSNGFGSDSGDSDTTRGQFFYDYSSSTDSILLLTPSHDKFLSQRASIAGIHTPRRDLLSKLSPTHSMEQTPPPSGRTRKATQTDPTTSSSKKNSSKRRRRRSSARFLPHENGGEQEGASTRSQTGITSGESLDHGSDVNTGHNLLQMTPIPHTHILKTALPNNTVAIKHEEEEPLAPGDAESPIQTSKTTPLESIAATSTTRKSSRRRSTRRSFGGSSYSQQTILKTARNLTLSDLESSEDDLAPPDMTFRLEPGEGVSVRLNPDGSFGGEADGESFIAGSGLNADDDLEDPPELQTFRLGDNATPRGNSYLRADEQQNILADLDEPHAAPTPDRRNRTRSLSITRSINRSRRMSHARHSTGLIYNDTQDLSQFTPEELEQSILSGPRRVARDNTQSQEQDTDINLQYYEEEEQPPNGQLYYPELDTEIEDDDPAEQPEQYAQVNGHYSPEEDRRNDNEQHNRLENGQEDQYQEDDLVPDPEEACREEQGHAYTESEPYYQEVQGDYQDDDRAEQEYINPESHDNGNPQHLNEHEPDMEHHNTTSRNYLERGNYNGPDNYEELQYAEYESARGYEQGDHPDYKEFTAHEQENQAGPHEREADYDYEEEVERRFHKAESGSRYGEEPQGHGDGKQVDGPLREGSLVQPDQVEALSNMPTDNYGPTSRPTQHIPSNQTTRSPPLTQPAFFHQTSPRLSVHNSYSEAQTLSRPTEPAQTSPSLSIHTSSPDALHPSAESPPQLRERGTAILKRKAFETSFADHSIDTTHTTDAADVTHNLGSRKPARVKAQPRKKRRRLELDWNANHWNRLYVCLQKLENGGQGSEAQQSSLPGFNLPDVPLSVRSEFPEFSKLELGRRMLALSRVKALKQQQHQQQRQQQKRP